MKMEELMIGDWVDETIVGKHQWYLYDYPEFNEKYVTPIPLTEEILEANGIPTNGDTFYFKEDEDCALELIYESNKLRWSINLAEYIVIDFTYVHQLQHALRLCGLNEIADNFKVI